MLTDLIALGPVDAHGGGKAWAEQPGQEVRHSYSVSLESWLGPGTTGGHGSCAGTLTWHTLMLSCEVCNLSRKLCISSGRLEYIRYLKYLVVFNF